MQSVILLDKTKQEFGYDANTFSKGSHKEIYISCDYCGEPKKLSIRNFYKGIGLSHNKCKDKKSKQTNREKYGVDHPLQLKQYQDKQKRTNKERYGTEFVAQSDEIKDKIKKTNLKKYGHENVASNPDIYNKTKNTLKEKYNVTNPMRSEEFKQKQQKSLYDNYGVVVPAKSKVIQEKTRNTNRDRYGVDYALSLDQTQDKIKSTNLKKYGTERPSQNKDIKDKIKKTNLHKYGYESPLSNQEIKNKIKQTNLNKYGTEYPVENEVIKEHIRKGRLLNKYDEYKSKFTHIEFLFTAQDYKGNIEQNNKLIKYPFKCKKCSYKFKSGLYNGRVPVCRKCFPIHNVSTQEREIYKFLKSICSYTLVRNCRNILPNNQEIDIYIPELKIGIEYHGLYWHSEIKGNKDKFYHYNKYKDCNDKDIRLIQIFGDEWIFKEDIIKAMLSYRLGVSSNSIYARNCSIKILDHKIKNKFLNKYHLQGSDNSSINLGAYCDDRLVAVMTFMKNKRGGKSEGIYELSRFCTKGSVIGIASKLFKYFINNYSFNKIISFADLRWSQGNLYDKIGFDFAYVTQPNYWYITGQNRVHRFNFRKKLLSKKLNTFQPELTEWENMQLNGWDRIWDCGSLKYEYTKKD